jgi:hypothetical protein
MFISNLTGKTYNSKSTEPLNCTTKNVIFGIECTGRGLTFGGETNQLCNNFCIFEQNVQINVSPLWSMYHLFLLFESKGE